MAGHLYCFSDVWLGTARTLGAEKGQGGMKLLKNLQGVL
jgi:hypothetical protein